MWTTILFNFFFRQTSNTFIGPRLASLQVTTATMASMQVTTATVSSIQTQLI